MPEAEVVAEKAAEVAVAPEAEVVAEVASEVVAEVVAEVAVAPEAEVVAAGHAMRTCGLPCLDMWDRLLGRQAIIHFHEDNETAISAMRFG